MKKRRRKVLKTVRVLKFTQGTIFMLGFIIFIFMLAVVQTSELNEITDKQFWIYIFYCFLGWFILYGFNKLVESLLEEIRRINRGYHEYLRLIS